MRCGRAARGAARARGGGAGGIEAGARADLVALDAGALVLAGLSGDAVLDAWIFAAAVLLNVTGLFLGYTTGRLFGFDLLKKRALSIEIGMQNAGLGSVLALKHFNERVALPAVIFVFICLFSASFLFPLWSPPRHAPSWG